MKPKTIVILLILLVACTAYIVIQHTNLFKHSESATQPSPSGGPVFTPAVTDIQKITIVPASGAKTVLAKEKDHWRVVEPYQWAANDVRVNTLVGQFERLNAKRSFDPSRNEGDAVDDKLAGLDRPLYTITLQNAKGAGRTLRVGRAVPLDPQKTYVRPDGDTKTYVAEMNFATAISPAAEYRDLTIIPALATDMTHLDVKGAQSFELDRTGEQWSLVKPVQDSADAGKVAALLGNLSRLSATKFVADKPTDLSAYGLDTGREQAVIRVWVKEEKEASPLPSVIQPAIDAAATGPSGKLYTLAIGTTAEEGKSLYAKLADSPAVFLLDANLLKEFQADPNNLRDKKLLNVDPAKVSAAEIKLPDSQVKLVRENNAWRMQTPASGPANDEAVTKLVQSLSTVQAKAFPRQDQTAESMGLDKPRATISLTLSGTGGTSSALVLEIGSATKMGEAVFVRAIGSKAAAIIDKADADALLTAEPANYYDPVLQTVEPNMSIYEIRVERNDGAFTMWPDGKAWKVSIGSATTTQPADAETSRNIASALSNLKANKIVSIGKMIPDKYAKASGLVTITAVSQLAKPMSTSGPAPFGPPLAQRTHFAKIDGKTYAWHDLNAGSNPVGEFPGGLFDLVNGELLSRVVWTIDPAAATSIKLTTPAAKETLELRKEGDKWVVPGDAYAKVDSQKVLAFLDDLQDLKAQKFRTRQAVSDPAKELGAPELTLELSGAKGTIAKLTVGKADAQGVRPAIASTVPGLFELSAADFAMLAKTWKDFQAKAAEERPTGPGVGPGPGPDDRNFAP